MGFIGILLEWIIMMKKFTENASVIYTDNDGNKIDTFVIFDTDELTGLTHINYENRRVSVESLVLHSKTVGLYHMPLDDAFSFQMLSMLKEKYFKKDTERKTLHMQPEKQAGNMYLLANAS